MGNNVRSVRMDSTIEKEELNVKVRLSESEFKIVNIQSLRELTTEQGRLLVIINQKMWEGGVDIQEFKSAIYSLHETYKEIESDQQLSSTSSSRNIFQCGDDSNRTLILVHDEDAGTTWIGLNSSTIERVPFLEAFCSDRWSSEIPTLRSVKAKVLKFVVYVIGNGRDFENTLITMMPLAAFDVQYEDLITDLDFLNLEYKKQIEDELHISDIEYICMDIRATSVAQRSFDFPDKQESRKSAEALMIAIKEVKLIFSQLSNHNKNQVYESILFIASHPGTFGPNQRTFLREVTTKLPLSIKQKAKLQTWFNSCRFPCADFDEDSQSYHVYSDDSDDSFNFYDSDFYYESD